MTEFLRLLSMYYMCDSIAAIRPLDPEEYMRCQGTYETVKMYFSGLETDELVDASARNRMAYIGFKDWEAENAELVAQLRASARAKVGG